VDVTPDEAWGVLWGCLLLGLLLHRPNVRRRAAAVVVLAVVVVCVVV
jgi:hypothetical protein